ncbi:MAG: hypothetical protein ABFD80_13425 [Acidobacteriota bacterium]
MAVSARLYRVIMYALALVFAAVGLLFLIAPDGVTSFFNSLPVPLRLRPAPAPGRGLFVVLAGAYMVVVTLLAVRAARHSEDKTPAVLLAQAKLASSALSFVVFFTASPYLILLANGIVDGGLGLAVLLLAGALKR